MSMSDIEMAIEVHLNDLAQADAEAEQQHEAAIAADLRAYETWCDRNDLDPLDDESGDAYSEYLDSFC